MHTESTPPITNPPSRQGSPLRPSARHQLRTLFTRRPNLTSPHPALFILAILITTTHHLNSSHQITQNDPLQQNIQKPHLASLGPHPATSNPLSVPPLPLPSPS